jgi:hypothetical protein
MAFERLSAGAVVAGENAAGKKGQDSDRPDFTKCNQVSQE